MKRALITGITGQDGSYLAEFLLDKGYEVHGIQRRRSVVDSARIVHLRGDDHLFLHQCDVADSDGLNKLIDWIEPHEVYHLASQSNARISFRVPEYTGNVNGLGTTRILNAIHETGATAKFFQAGSSEMFGRPRETPQRETTPFYPRNPYAIAKVYAHWTTVNYRESYGLFACNGIMFNHESPRRGETFVTRKITSAVARIRSGSQEKLRLGNIDVKRDWGYAKEYVEAMWLMLQQEEPDDYIIATGETHTVREFMELSFDHAGLDWRDHVVIDSECHRPVGVGLSVGDASKAKKDLGWVAETKFHDLVHLMVSSDIVATRQ